MITHLCLYQVSLAGSVPEVPAAESIRCDWDPAGYRASGQQGTGTGSKGATSIVFIPCLGLLLNIRVITGPV